MENQDEMLNTIGNDRGMRLMDIAKQDYPYLADKDIAYTFTPAQDDRQLEFYPPDEPGSPDYPRPQELPMGRVGIQVFNPKVRPIDLLGDYVSHYGVYNDPQLKDLYGQFTGAVNPQAMQERYAYHRQNFGEQRPYEQWAERTGYPELFRGYTFNQWENAAQMYTPEQLDILNRVRKYLGIK